MFVLSFVGVPEPEEAAVVATPVRVLFVDPLDEAGAEVEAPGVWAAKVGGASVSI
jgi:hypothetical protein